MREKRKHLTLSELRKRFAASNASYEQDLFWFAGYGPLDSGDALRPDNALPAMHAIRKAVEHCIKADKSMDFLYGFRRRSDFLSE